MEEEEDVVLFSRSVVPGYWEEWEEVAVGLDHGMEPRYLSTSVACGVSFYVVQGNREMTGMAKGDLDRANEPRHQILHGHKDHYSSHCGCDENYAEGKEGNMVSPSEWNTQGRENRGSSNDSSSNGRETHIGCGRRR